VQTGGQQNDSDDEGLEISATILSLRDPNTSTRVVTPARFLGVGGIVAFDLDTYLEVVKKSRKWLCPFSTKPFSIRELQLDGFLGPVLAALKVRCLSLPILALVVPRKSACMCLITFTCA
jgi:hypothetical protein